MMVTSPYHVEKMGLKVEVFIDGFSVDIIMTLPLIFNQDYQSHGYCG